MTQDIAGVEHFLASAMPQLTQADRALHNGDAAPRVALWSKKDPVTVFGAVVTKVGWDEVGPMFEWLASRFSHCSSFEYEVIAADVSGDLAYVAGVEHTTASVAGAEPVPYTLRVTTVFRREDGQWRPVHRHADPVPDSPTATQQQTRMAAQLDGSRPR